MDDKTISSLDIKKEILSSFNYDKTTKTIEDMLHNRKTEKYNGDLLLLYEREAERLVRNSFIIKKNGHSYVLSRNDEDKYYLEKAGMMDIFMNFLYNF